MELPILPKQAEYIATKMGWPVERAARILTLGEPWPFQDVLGDWLQSSQKDAVASGAKLSSSLKARASLLKTMGSEDERLKQEFVEKHAKRVAALSGETKETVLLLEAALFAYYREVFGLVLRHLDSLISRNQK